jgi:serine/threonine protein kinase
VTVHEAAHDIFTEGVDINIRMAQKNILCLVGCCLEVDGPMLVYYFVDNSSLKDILHVSKQELPLDLHLDIAIGSTEGLRQIHLYTPRTLCHGDIKTDNILLTEMLTPKLSCFGLLKEQHFSTTVVGSIGYTDPISLITGFLTQKSDLYSFGVVLLEIITRKRSIYGENCSLVLEFSKVYETERRGKSMFDKEIATEENMIWLEQIGKLATECLKEDVGHRPDMTDIAERLMIIRRDRETKGEGEANWPS